MSQKQCGGTDALRPSSLGFGRLAQPSYLGRPQDSDRVRPRDFLSSSGIIDGFRKKYSRRRARGADDGGTDSSGTTDIRGVADGGDEEEEQDV